MTPRSHPMRGGAPAFRDFRDFRDFRGSGGFTLVELAACLVIVGLLMGLAAISLRGLGQAVEREDVVERLALWDRLAREQARRLDRPTQLVFDLDRQMVSRSVMEATGDRMMAAGTWALPAGHRLDRVHVSGDDEPDGSWNRVTIPISSRGHSPSYVIELAPAGGGERGSGGRPAVVVVAGLSGQIMEAESREQIDALFETLARR